MRILPLLLLVLSTLIAGCSSPEEKLAGRWGCSTRHPGGFVSDDIFEFGADGKLLLNSDQMAMHGTYTLKDDQLLMQLNDVPTPDGATQAQTLTATIKELTSERLQMDVSTGSDKHQSSCQHG